MERKEYDIVIRLVGNQRPCHVGHETGDEWVLKDKTPEGICTWAYNSIYPMALTLQYGGMFPWQQDPDILQVSCPDGKVNNIFELRRIPSE
ncbi:TIGR04076 family protein [Chloroflexota bacterium]